MSPEQDSSPELEALVMQGEENKESLNNVEANTGATAVAIDKSNQKLEDIDSNMEARLVQAENHINKLAPSIESMGKAMKTVDTLLNTMRGPQGEKGDEGKKGDKGEKGDNGDKGEDAHMVGPQGPQGVVGPQGPEGKQGKAGPRGPIGLTGEDGKPGKDGKDGKDGQSVDEEKILKKLTKGIDKEMDGVRRYVQGSKSLDTTGVTDGDKGDITVSGSGSVWSIDNDVVGPAELANTTVVAGSYINTNLTVDEQGRITSAANGSGGTLTEELAIAYAASL